MSETFKDLSNIVSDIISTVDELEKQGEDVTDKRAMVAEKMLNVYNSVRIKPFASGNTFCFGPPKPDGKGGVDCSIRCGEPMMMEHMFFQPKNEEMEKKLEEFQLVKEYCKNDYNMAARVVKAFKGRTDLMLAAISQCENDYTKFVRFVEDLENDAEQSTVVII
jgi:hypothetical protein